MLHKYSILVSIGILIITACQDDWNSYYYRDPGENIERTVWEVISDNPDYSRFVELIRENQLESIFTTDRTLTVFVPTNEAFADFVPDSMDIKILLQYHIIETLLNIPDVQKFRIIETSSKKFALLERLNDIFTIDGEEITYFSPLCKDGRYYELKKALYPRPNLYEFVSVNSNIIKRYIDQFERIVLDYDKSIPLYFDNDGNTVYDSVYTKINLFDQNFFPVNTEFRRTMATIVIFDEEQYHTALDEMAGKLGGAFTDHHDIPESWQFDVLLPRVIEDGIFEGALQYSDFTRGRLRNIAGDSVNVDFLNIDKNFRLVASNGIIFKYNNYEVPEAMYLLERKVQGEHLVRPVGAGTYGWKQGVVTSGGAGRAPTLSFSAAADNDSLIQLDFGSRFTDQFNLEFYIPQVFPRRYRLEWKTNSRPSGIFEVYVNDVVVGQIDLFTLRNARQSVTGALFVPDRGLNRVDFLVDHITEYGDVKIGIKYIGQGTSTNNGFAIDYFSLIPFPL